MKVKAGWKRIAQVEAQLWIWMREVAAPEPPADTLANILSLIGYRTEVSVSVVALGRWPGVMSDRERSRRARSAMWR